MIARNERSLWGSKGINWPHSVNYPGVAILACDMRIVYYMVRPNNSDQNMTPQFSSSIQRKKLDPTPANMKTL